MPQLLRFADQTILQTVALISVEILIVDLLEGDC